MMWVVKRCIYQSKKESNKQFGNVKNYDVNGKRKLFWKVMNKVNDGKMENCNRIKYITGKLAARDCGRMTWKEYFEVLYNVNTKM